MLLLLIFHFDVIAISESKLGKIGDVKIASVNIEPDGYSSQNSCLSDSAKGGVLLYVSSEHNVIPPMDLQIYSFNTWYFYRNSKSKLKKISSRCNLR